MRHLLSQGSESEGKGMGVGMLFNPTALHQEGPRRVGIRGKSQHIERGSEWGMRCPKDPTLSSRTADRKDSGKDVTERIRGIGGGRCAWGR